LSATVGKIEQRVCIRFCVKLGKSAIETIEMLCEAFENFLYTGQQFLNGIHVSRLVECRLKMTNVPGRPSTRKTTENVEKTRELIHEDHC
jgi:hypothetical protein